MGHRHHAKGHAKQTERRPGEPFPVLWAVLIAALAFGAYAGTLGHGFILDDASLIAQSSVIRGLQWGAIVDWGSYRPVRTLTYALNYALGGDDPFGYHLLNVLLHSLNAFLVFLLFHRWRAPRLAAVVGAALFAVHPVQTAAVAYVSGRKDELAALFVVAACLAFTSYLRRRTALTFALVFIFYLLAVLSKEVAVVFPALALLIDLLIVGPENRASGESPERSLLASVGDALKRSPAFYGLCLALIGAGAYYSVFVIKASRAQGFLGGSAATHYGTVFKLFTHYVKLAVTAYPLVADYTGQVIKLSRGFTEPVTLLSVGFTIAYLVAALVMRRRIPVVTFGMLWFLVVLLPILQIMPFHELAADHYLYLALIGPVLMVGQAVAFIARRWNTRLAVAAAGALIAVCLIATIDRSRDWKDEYTLWSETYRVAPDSYRANMNLGVYYSSKDIDKAILHTRRSLELDPGREQAWSNLGGLYKSKATSLREAGNYTEAERLERQAIDHLKHAIQMSPQDVWAHMNLGQVYRDLGLIMQAQGRFQEMRDMRQKAVESYFAALRIGSDNPYFPLVWSEMGKVFMDAGYYDQAVVYFGEALKAFPNRTDILYSMGLCHFTLREHSQAIEYLEQVVELTPDSPVTVWGMLAKSHEERGNYRRAIEVYERARARYPKSVDILYNLGVLYHRVGDLKTAIKRLELCLEFAPDGPLAGNARKMLEVMKEDLEERRANQSYELSR